AELLAHAAPVLQYLCSTHQELRDAAQVLPTLLHELSHREPHPGADARLVAAAERRFGEPVPGQTLVAQAARVRDAKYWRRFLVRRVREARERLHLQLGLVGAGARQYCSEGAREHRQVQLVKQDEWLKSTMLRGVIGGKLVELPLAQVVKGAHQKLSKLYAFISAMDRLAVDAGLTVALLTTTLEGQWHANPEFKLEGHCWNGATPRDANRELGQRFQDIRRDLDKQGVKLSGLWAGEPHADGCPHRHHWLMYDPQHKRAVLAAFLRYFPGKLKLRRDRCDGGDVIIETREDALHGLHRPLKHAREGAQVDVSIIDREKGSGASYVLKYVLKAVLPELSYEGLAAPLGQATPERPTKKRSAAEARKELRSLQSVDAHRSVWRMRSFQLFGIRNCLTLWDELRRIKHAPAEPELKKLWRLARGGEAEGNVSADEQRGDAYGFLKALGGLAAVAQPEQFELGAEASSCKARIYTEPTTTRYGETGSRIKGVELVQPGAEPVVLERVETRSVTWELVAKGETTKCPVGAAAPGKGRTAMTNRQPPAPGAGAPGDS
ncbi:MAG TPA: replication endonuclease, partial [Burkholderiaceae bacterium]|nr:replication endonuclease [Burkholderiaceae bacterium]